MKGRHRQRDIMDGARSIYWARRDLGNAAADVLGPNLAIAGAMCAAFWLGWFGRSCEATPGSFTRDEYWSPGCGREARLVGASKDGGE